jgi:hypothetical protein
MIKGMGYLDVIERLVRDNTLTISVITGIEQWKLRAAFDGSLRLSTSEELTLDELFTKYEIAIKFVNVEQLRSRLFVPE